jgi:hypothetical protein
MDRPVAVVDAPAPARPPTASTPQPDPIVLDPTDARRTLHALIAPDGHLVAALAAVLGPDGNGLAVDAVDDMVALAVAVTAGSAFDATDHLVLAVALYLRGRLDAERCAREPGGDFELSGDALVRASGALRSSHPLAVPVVNRLAALLDRVRPAGHLHSRVSGAARAAPDSGSTAVFVIDPRRDRGDAEQVRRAFYPNGRVLSPATGADVLAGLCTRMLQFGCGVTPAGSLKLVDGNELSPERIRAAGTAGGLAVLPPTGVGLPALGGALLAAGFRGVVTWKRVVPARVAALMLFELHAALVGDACNPEAAVTHVRDWMRDPRRRRPSRMPEEYAATFARRDLVDEAYWGALVFRDH